MKKHLIVSLALAAISLNVRLEAAAPHRYDHVVIVAADDRAVGSITADVTSAPYINSLAVGGASMGNLFGIEHPSQPNQPDASSASA